MQDGHDQFNLHLLFREFISYESSNFKHQRRLQYVIKKYAFSIDDL